jgi:3-deoxy-manno-octulosonate cytidylyltransferase (CMP-KDO synthetase)
MRICYICDICLVMKTVAIIPARYASSRLEGKPLLDIAGKPMVQRVYEAASQAELIDRVIVATDDRRILDTVTDFGGEAELTSTHHMSGTDRVAEVADRLHCDTVVNLQGDEPLMEPPLIDELIRPLLDDPGMYMASAQSPIRLGAHLTNPNIVKVVSDQDGYALYFSRSPIPYHFNSDQTARGFLGFKHIGIYIYRKDFLMKLVKLDPSPLEKKERLEQLRVLENGYRIKLISTDYDAPAVDTPADLEQVREKIEQLEDA